jgi:hypothetical protein
MFSKNDEKIKMFKFHFRLRGKLLMNLKTMDRKQVPLKVPVDILDISRINRGRHSPAIPLGDLVFNTKNVKSKST